MQLCKVTSNNRKVVHVRLWYSVKGTVFSEWAHAVSGFSSAKFTAIKSFLVMDFGCGFRPRVLVSL